MTVDELVNELGLDSETAAIVKAKVQADKVSSLKAKREWDTLEQQRQALESELVADGKKGARNYKQWYEQNFAKIQELQASYAKYVERYGALDGNPNPQNPNPNPQNPNPGVDQKTLDERLSAITDRMSSLLVNSGTILERHVRSGRKNNIDWKALAELAAEKHNGNLEAAYTEWDAPEAQKATEAAKEAEIERRVQERLKKTNVNSFFPTTEQVSTGVSPLSKDRGDAPKYDRSKVVESAITGLYEPATVS